MEVLVAVAEGGSLAAAARRLRLSAPAVTRIVAGLEGRLGARLLQRTTRRVQLTEAGRTYLAAARRVLADLEAAERAVAGEALEVRGRLVVGGPTTFGRMHLAPVVAAFLERHPEVSCRLLLVDRVVSLVEEGIDVTVRIGALPDSTLLARRVGEVRRMLVASPAYLARRGIPTAPGDLAGHSLLGFTGTAPGRVWTLERDGRPLPIRVEPRLEANDAATAVALAEAGHGIAFVLSYQAAEGLAADRLVEVLPGFAPAPVPVQLVHAEHALVAPRIRAFLDLAAPLLRARLEAPAAQPAATSGGRASRAATRSTASRVENGLTM
jgi:DNA-binding transcriptional LysR family regulator